MPHLPFPLFVLGLAVCALLIVFGLLHDREMDRAEERAELREPVLVETVELPASDGWVPGHGTEHFFETDYVWYDPEAHAREIIGKMTADTEEFMAYLHDLAGD